MDATPCFSFNMDKKLDVESLEWHVNVRKIIIFFRRNVIPWGVSHQMNNRATQGYFFSPYKPET